MTESDTRQGVMERLGAAVATATAAATAATWALLVFLSGPLIPRPLLIVASLAIALAACAVHAVKSRNHWALLLIASFSALPPPTIGGAPDQFRYIGFLAVGYGVAAILLAAAKASPRRERSGT
jgi:hypothetical protein